jgi:hypothetical protein
MANRLCGKVDVAGKMDSFNSQVSKMGKCRRLATAGRSVVGEMGAGCQVELGAFEKELPVRQGPYRAQRLVSTLLRGKLPGTQPAAWAFPAEFILVYTTYVLALTSICG